MEKISSSQSLHALNWTILLISGIQAGIGPFLAVYLKSDLQWDPSQIGNALGIVSFAAMLAQIPSGLLIDAFKIKKILLGLSCLIIAVSCFLIPHLPYVLPILTLQFFIGLAIAIIPQAILAITLGLVGLEQFPKRNSTNESLSHIGNMLLAFIAGLCSYFLGNIWIMYTYSLFSFSGIFPLSLIRRKDIDHDIARLLPRVIGSKLENKNVIVPIKKVLFLPVNIIFLISVFLFHFSSSAQLTLVAQLFVQSNPKMNALFMASSLIISHFIMMCVSIILRYYIQDIDRKPLFLLILILIFLRGILFTFSHNPYFMIALQILDGLSGGIFGVIGVVILAELAQNTGRFNFMHGLMSLCQGMAYALSNIMSGYVSKLYGFNAGFYSLSLFAMVGFILFLLFMPETHKKKFF